ncbi:hypothetical protein M7I_5589 [Glarea lozoyensis 74030]|uniref:Uncharacterized protein n=1 Tax=Glarea lozoyensis (strain ATCC 74030 / MF5533) TaxID=1104152 RepID=H0ESB1_GLAL7|nr:hypothetical protein M7I_5589 [Glarea lozoyensis 74030]
MPLFRPVFKPSMALRSFGRGPLRQPEAIRAISSTPALSAQGYGDPDGNPDASNPQEQPGSSDAKQNAEHPGPEPPSVGQNTGAGPTKAGNSKQTPEDASAQSGGSRSKEAKETGSSPTGGEVKNGGKNSGDDGSSSKIRNEMAQEKTHKILSL